MGRTIATLTTIPSGVPGALEVVEALLKEKELDMIYLNWPYNLAKSGEKYPDPVIEGVLLDPRVRVNRCKDVGPITKLYPILALERDPETKILIVDDDHLPQEGIVAKMSEYLDSHPSWTVTTGGWVKGRGIFSYQPQSKNFSGVCRVDWVEGAGGIMTLRKFLDEELILDYSKAGAIASLFKKHDDHWLSWHLIERGSELWSVPLFYGDQPVKHPKKENISGSLNFYREVHQISSFLAHKNIYQQKVKNWLPVPLSLYGVLALAFLTLMTWWLYKNFRLRK